MTSPARIGSKEGQRGRTALILAGVGFAVFVANAVAGKVSLLLGASTPVHMGNVPEFVLLVVAVSCFVIGILEKERAQAGGPIEQLNQREEKAP